MCMFSGFIRVGSFIHRHLPGRVLRQFGYEQTIPRSPNVVPDADIPTIDERWIHLRQNVFMNVTPASSPSACVAKYLQWFMRVSHPYLIHGADDDRPSLVPRQRRHLPDDIPSDRRNESSSRGGRRSKSSSRGLLGAMKHIVTGLQQMIDCWDVIEGTVAWQQTNELLKIAR